MNRQIYLISLAAVLTLSACSLPPEQVRAYRAEHCPLSKYNPAGHKVGDLVTIRVSGNRGQLLTIPSYRRKGDRAISGEECDMRSTTFEVRVDTHGIAREGGNWNTARPEVLPVLEFLHFELEPLPGT